MSSNNKSNNKRILKNTIALYIRMLFKLIVTLYTSRVILIYLGVDDWGIYNVVAGIVTIFTFITGSMAVSVQRFLSFELGRIHNENLEPFRSVFRTSVQIHVITSIIVFILSESVGLFVFGNLNIPVERIEVSQILYQYSIIACCLHILQIPMAALLIALEKITFYAYIGIIEVVLKLCIVFLLPILPFDRLISFGILTLTVTVLITILYFISCKLQPYKLSFISTTLNKHIFRSMISFSGWSFLVEFAWTAVTQGTMILLNIFFSTAVNSAAGIANQVKGAINQFAINIQTAVNPQIIKLYAAKEINQMYSLSLLGTRFSYFLLYFVSLPIILNMDTILSLWLKDVPPHTCIFSQLTLIGALIESTTSIFNSVNKATGDIRRFQIYISCFFTLNLIFSYIALRFGAPPSSVYAIYAFIALVTAITRIRIVTKQINVSIKEYCTKALIPILKVTLSSFPLPYLLSTFIHNNNTNLIITTSASLIISGLSIVLLGTSVDERRYIYSYINKHVTNAKIWHNS